MGTRGIARPSKRRSVIRIMPPKNAIAVRCSDMITGYASPDSRTDVASVVSRIQ
jgi:hypothetical protein